MNKVNLNVDWDAKPIVVMVSGTIDSLNSHTAHQQFCDIAQQAQGNICLDFQSVAFLDSTSIGAIVHLYKKLRCKKLELSITGLHEQPYGLFSLLGLNAIMPCNKA